MGVMHCNRKGCVHIMCDRYSEKFGYLCSECFDELIEFVLLEGEGAIELESMKKFMETNKTHKSSRRIDVGKVAAEEFEWFLRR
jgi:hypothetical protein